MASIPEASLSDRQRQLYAAVIKRSSAVNEQLLLLSTQAMRVGASEHDVRMVREKILAGHVKECRG